MELWLAEYWPQIISVIVTIIVMCFGVPKLQEWFGWFTSNLADKFKMIVKLMEMIEAFVKSAEEKVLSDGKLTPEEAQVLIAELKAIIEFAKTIFQSEIIKRLL